MSTTAGFKKSIVREYFESIVIAVILALFVRTWVVQAFKIPTGSMENNLLIGDHLLVNKFIVGPTPLAIGRAVLPVRPIRRGDIVVFKYPDEPDRDFIKRVIGMPGDRIQMINGVLTINGEPIQRESLGDRPFENEHGIIEHIQTYRETLPNGVSYIAFDRGSMELDNTRVFEVPEGHYFMMGDDRDNSADSRVPSVVGFVPYDNLVGPAQFIVVSFNNSTSIFRPWTLFTGFRGDRFLKSVN